MFRLAPLSLLAAAVPQQLSEHTVPNIFHPLSSVARTEMNLGFLVFAITGCIFVVVASLLAYTMIRFRGRANPDGEAVNEPAQVYGSNRIEAAWTVIPILIVFVLIGVSSRAVWGIQDASPPPDAVQIQVTGHQYWWEIRYPGYDVVTANEIHVPVALNGRHASYLQLKSADVIHSLWVPELGGKTDLIPGRTNHMWFDPVEAGVYRGNCTEFCGVQHANMLLEVVVQQPDDFRAWIAAQQKPQALSVSAGQRAFQTAGCFACHAIKGTHFMGRLGPDLTHVASRRTIGSGILPNTPASLRSWIANPQDSKPGCLMPGMKLSGPALDNLTAYLETLN